MSFGTRERLPIRAERREASMRVTDMKAAAERDARVRLEGNKNLIAAAQQARVRRCGRRHGQSPGLRTRR
ncbi:MAG: hypothetical protein ACE14M_10880 [Terriglobales bacterium]